MSNLWSISVSAARTSACVALGYSAADCASTFHDEGTFLNGAEVSVQTPLLASNAQVSGQSWLPANAYRYTARPVTGLAISVVTNAGAQTRL